MLIRATKMAMCIAMGVVVAQAFAGGDDYDAANDVKGAGPAYFGFVRDNRGSPVVDAQVRSTALARRCCRTASRTRTSGAAGSCACPDRNWDESCTSSNGKAGACRPPSKS